MSSAALKRALLLPHHLLLRASPSRRLLSGSIDVHTHMYTPIYMKLLRERTSVPRVFTAGGVDRLVILPGEDLEKSTNIGRPIGREYFDVAAKLRFMDQHGIDKSIVSLANPWLDFLVDKEAEDMAQQLNDELVRICEGSKGRLFGFATLPVRNTKACLREIERLRGSRLVKGVILGTPGAGRGIDHDDMREVLLSLASADMTIFLHPHYGVGNEHYHDSGHALFLALGFPFETTVAISRLIVTGRLDEVPDLKILVAHAGAALPSLIGRLDSCVQHDIAIAKKLRHAPSEYFKRLYFDAISYNTPALEALVKMVGGDRIMFGTDNPFFPPPGVDDVVNSVWPSTQKVYASLDPLPEPVRKAILSGTAAKLFGL